MNREAEGLTAVILAAGVGSRLGKSYPKPLTILHDGASILEQLLGKLDPYVGADNVWIVVGYKKGLIMEEFPSNVYVYNDRFSATNTAKSLLRAASKCSGHDLLWINGDVVLDEAVIAQVLDAPGSSAAVAPGPVGDEEVKYITDGVGAIRQISKAVSDAEGEAVGVNLIRAADLSTFVSCLERCADDDYFERGMELAIDEGVRVQAVDISACRCVEIDSQEDLDRARGLWRARARQPAAIASISGSRRRMVADARPA